MPKPKIPADVLIQAVLDLVSQSDDGVFAVDADQRIVFWSDRMAAISGMAAEAVAGEHCYEILQGVKRFGGAMCSPDCPVYHAALSGKKPESFEMTAPGAGGKALSVSVIPAGSVGGPLLVHLVRDVTIRERAERLARSGLAAAELRDATPAEGRPRLRRREIEVLRLIADGYTTAAMAAHLGITIITVHNHVQAILKKLGVHTRREAVREGAHLGLL